MKDFFSELKRRKVFRVAAVYLVAAWALIQVADVIFPRLDLPEWTVTLVIVLIGLGFPLALALSWAFDATPQGVRRTPGDDESAASQPKGWALWTGAAVAGAIVALGGWLWLGGRGPSAGGNAAIEPSIAVLPFRNMSSSQEDEYFSDGITEELTSALAKVPGLRVAARTSAFQFKGQEVDVRELASALNVATVLEGSVQRSGNRLRITAQLIDTETGYHLWTERYDRQAGDIFAIEDEISSAITEALRIALTPVEADAASRRITPSLAGHDLYLLGLYYWNRRQIAEAIDYFQQAIAEDPGYARATRGSPWHRCCSRSSLGPGPWRLCRRLDSRRSERSRSTARCRMRTWPSDGLPTGWTGMAPLPNASSARRSRSTRTARAHTIIIQAC